MRLKRAPLPSLNMAYLPGVGVIWKDPEPMHYRRAIFFLRERPLFTRDFALIERLEKTLRRIEWTRK